MKKYSLFYDNWETGESGKMWMEFIPSTTVEYVIECFFLIIGNSVNPFATLTLVEE